ncbi:MAG: hypothetical protein J0L84_01395 [Verrucomicrobia bacterium]|nr:hypothetical protein [Verrucomicrobiota bacterium]
MGELAGHVFDSAPGRQELCREESEPKELGFLQLCMERRFHRIVQEKFEELSGLQPHDYWSHSDAGGAPKMEPEENRAKYAYDHGARHMGWSAHGDGCGGFKPPFHPHEAGDDEIRTALLATLMKKVFLYPEASHYAIFATKDAQGNASVWWRGPVRQDG